MWQLQPEYGFTPKEFEVAKALGRGLANKEIAEELGIAERTAKNYIRALRGKTGARNRVQLGIFLFENLYTREEQEEIFAARRRFGAKTVLPRLSPRQRECAMYAMRAFTNREIADVMGTTEGVIKNMMRHIYDKTGMGNRFELLFLLSVESGRPARHDRSDYSNEEFLSRIAALVNGGAVSGITVNYKDGNCARWIEAPQNGAPCESRSSLGAARRNPAPTTPSFT